MDDWSDRSQQWEQCLSSTALLMLHCWLRQIGMNAEMMVVSGICADAVAFGATDVIEGTRRRVVMTVIPIDPFVSQYLSMRQRMRQVTIEVVADERMRWLLTDSYERTTIHDSSDDHTSLYHH